MRTVKLAKFLAHKYTVAVSTADLEVMVRKQIDTLYGYINGTYKALRDCAMADASNPTNEQEELAVKGHRFCKQLVTIVDYLKKNRNDIPMPELQSALVRLSTLIDENLKIKGDVQFPQISALVWEMIPMGGQKVKPAYVEKVRKEMANKVRHGIMRLKSVATTMLDQLEQMGMASSPAKGRFTAERTSLDLYDVIKFIRTYGPQYGIQDEGDWEIVFRNDPQFLQDMTTVIYAKERAHTPREEEQVKAKALQALRDHRARTEGGNQPYFEAGEGEAKQMWAPEQEAVPSAPKSAPAPSFNPHLQKSIEERDERHRQQQEIMENWKQQYEEEKNKQSFYNFDRLLRKYQ